MTPEEQAQEFVERVLWNLVPELQLNARVEIAAMLKAEAERESECVIDALAVASNEALEKAARVADKAVAVFKGDKCASSVTAENIAAAIRALKE